MWKNADQENSNTDTFHEVGVFGHPTKQVEEVIHTFFAGRCPEKCFKTHSKTLETKIFY